MGTLDGTRFRKSNKGRRGDSIVGTTSVNTSPAFGKRAIVGTVSAGSSPAMDAGRRSLGILVPSEPMASEQSKEKV